MRLKICTSHHFSQLEVQTYDCTAQNGNLHKFTAAGGGKEKFAHLTIFHSLKYKTYDCAAQNGNLHKFTAAGGGREKFAHFTGF